MNIHNDIIQIEKNGTYDKTESFVIRMGAQWLRSILALI